MNLDITLGDNHPVDQEFHQLPPLFKGRMIQPALDTLTKCLNRVMECGNLLLAIHLSLKLRFLQSQCLDFLLEIRPSALVFG